MKKCKKCAELKLLLAKVRDDLRDASARHSGGSYALDKVRQELAVAKERVDVSKHNAAVIATIMKALADFK